MDDKPLDDEPLTQITRKVRTEVKKEEQDREILKYRRESDKWNYWVRTVSNFALGAIIPIVFAVVTWISYINSNQNKHDIIINRSVSDIDELSKEIRRMQDSKNNDAGFEKLFNIQINFIRERMGEQDRRITKIEGNLLAIKTKITELEDKQYKVK